EKLEFPTEAWAAQELRKANVLRLAAEHADEPLRGRLRRRGDELADRGWRDLMRFESRTLARALAIVFVEGMQDLCCRVGQNTAAPPGDHPADFGESTVFLPQKRRVLRQLRTVRGLCRLALRLANPANWPLRRLQPLDRHDRV